MAAKTSSTEPEIVCSSSSESLKISKDLNFRRVSETFDLFRVMGTNIIAPDKNGFGTLHGGAVGSLVVILCTACARTVIAEDKELFLGGISMSYLSGTPINEEVLANASVVKSGRNLTVVALEFKRKKTGNLLYNTHATFYSMPVASL